MFISCCVRLYKTMTLVPVCSVPGYLPWLVQRSCCSSTGVCGRGEWVSVCVCVWVCVCVCVCACACEWVSEWVSVCVSVCECMSVWVCVCESHHCYQLQELQQHDVQELNRILFSAIESSLLGTTGEHLIARLYHGTSVQQVRGASWGHRGGSQTWCNWRE